ncbi:hypothetical protein COO60DRAFT_789917 [Scenedesmus sp. NREL 46B-D3]|nr:hypothetical protein COO60DRAFT_789917 [Scenedesmus sp. NREL 46B-D3]
MTGSLGKEQYEGKPKKKKDKAIPTKYHPENHPTSDRKLITDVLRPPNVPFQPQPQPLNVTLTCFSCQPRNIHCVLQLTASAAVDAINSCSSASAAVEPRHQHLRTASRLPSCKPLQDNNPASMLLSMHSFTSNHAITKAHIPPLHQHMSCSHWLLDVLQLAVLLPLQPLGTHPPAGRSTAQQSNLVLQPQGRQQQPAACGLSARRCRGLLVFGPCCSRVLKQRWLLTAT